MAKKTTKKAAKKTAKKATKKVAKKPGSKKGATKKSPAKKSATKKKAAKRASSTPVDHDEREVATETHPTPVAEKAPAGGEAAPDAGREPEESDAEDKRAVHFWQGPAEHGEPPGTPRGRKPTKSSFKKRFKKRK